MTVTVKLTVAEARVLHEAAKAAAFGDGAEVAACLDWTNAKTVRLQRALAKLNVELTGADLAKQWAPNRHGEVL